MTLGQGQRPWVTPNYLNAPGSNLQKTLSKNLKLRQPFEIFRRGLLQLTPRSIENVERDPGPLTLTQGHQEEWMN